MRPLALVLLGLALRLLRLNALGDLEFDEIVSVRYAALAPAELLPRLSGALFEHPPVYYLLLGWWRGLAGDSDVAARLFSVLPGTATIALAYAAGRRLFGTRTGNIAAFLVAVSPLTLFYSREARMYALVACLVLASFWLLLLGMSRPRRWPHWLAYAVVAGLAALTHYAGLLAVGAQLLTVAVSPGARRSHLRPAVGAMGAVIGVMVLWTCSSSGVRGSLPAAEARYLADAPAALWHAWREMAGGPEQTGWHTALAGAATAVLACLGLARAFPGRLALALSLAVGLLAVVVAVGLGKPVQARYLLPSAPLALLGVAHAIASPRLQRVTWPLGAVALVAGMTPFWAHYYVEYRRADYSDVTREIAALERPGDAILLTGPWQAWYFDYYYPRQGGTILHQVLPENAPPALDPAVARPRLEALARTRRRLWFVQAGLAQADPTNFVEGWLNEHAWPATRAAHQNAVLSVYALQPPDVRRDLRPVQFGDSLRLAGGWIDGEEVPAADVARLWLEFEALGPIASDLKASVRLVGADGQRLAADFDLVDVARGAAPTSSWGPGTRAGLRRGIWIPPATNPQPYDVRLVVYDAKTLTPLPPREGGGVTVTGSGGEVTIGGAYVTQTRAKLPPRDPFERIERTFGGGDEFDALHLTGIRWHQNNPAAGPLSLDLLWRLNGLSGTTHLSSLVLVDERGAVVAEEARPLFGGTFNMWQWRDGETLGERRTLDARFLPDGRYALVVRLFDARGRVVPLDAATGGRWDTVHLGHITVPYRRPLTDRLQGAVDRLRRRIFPPKSG